MKNEKGVFLISSFLVLAVIGTFSLALYSRQFTALRSYERSQNLVRAFHLAESGVDLGITQLRQNSSYTGQGYASLGNGGGYEIQVETPDPAGSPNIRRITATGHTPSNLVASYAYERRQIVAYVDLAAASGFNFGIFGDSNVTASGKASTDSYNSNNGPYAPGGTNGDIGTNATGQGVITVSGDAKVGGDAVVGAGGNPAIAITTSGNGTILGTQTAAASPAPMDPVQIPSNLPNLGSLSVSGQTIMTLAGGSYWYESISVSGGASVQFTGSTTLYVSGPVSISGDGVFSSSDNLPPHLIVKVQGDANVNLSGEGNIYGAIYAPQSQVSISGNGELFGAIVGKTLSFSGSGRYPYMVHYDEALTNASGGSGTASTVQLRSWQEF